MINEEEKKAFASGLETLLDLSSTYYKVAKKKNMPNVKRLISMQKDGSNISLRYGVIGAGKILDNKIIELSFKNNDILLSEIYEIMLLKFGEENLSLITISNETLYGCGQSIDLSFSLEEPLIIEMISADEYDNEWMNRFSEERKPR